MPFKKKFDNKKVTQLLEKYVQNPKHLDEELRNKIIRKSMPLIDAALHKKRIPPDAISDIRQECALKLLSNLHRYKKGKSTGGAFSFFWTVICNHIITQIKKRVSKDVSLTNYESDSGEMEVVQADTFHTPENRYILRRIAVDLDKAFTVEEFPRQKGKKHRLAVKLLRNSVKDATLFTEAVTVTRRLRRLGFTSEEARNYRDFTLIRVRRSLLHAREEALGIAASKD